MLSSDDFSDRLQHLRRKAGISQAELADTVEASRDIIGKYERGSHSPSADMAIKLASALNVTVGFLLGVEDAQAIDEDTLNRLRALEKLDPKTKKTVLEVLDTFLRDASARNAYAA